jgi:hypothetical protein
MQRFSRVRAMWPGRSTVLALFGLIGIATTISAQSPAKTECRATPGATEHGRLIERWIDDVWHDGRVALVPEIVGPTYVRHELTGTRSVTPEAYAAEIASVRRALPGVRFLVHDCDAVGDRVWLRWTMIGTSAQTGKAVERVGMQVYRLDGGRLVETWVLMPATNMAWL